jgi:hypothetical protein
VGAVIDAYGGGDGAGSLAADPTADAARDALPAERLADVYLSRRGIARLVADPGSALRPLAPLVDPGASEGVAAALVASDDGLNLDLRSILDPARVAAHPGLLSGLPSFEPSLPASLPAESLGYLGLGDPGETIGSLLKRASASEPGLAVAAGELTKSLGGLGDLDLERELGPVLGDEGALALEPSGRGGSGAPVPVFVGEGVDESRAADALARLQRPGATGSEAHPGGQARRRIGEVTAHSVRISPTVELTYAVVGGALVIAADPAGVRAVVNASSGLGGSDGFRAATAGLPGDVSMLGYLNLGALIALAERAGLADNPAYATFAPEIRRLEALGLVVDGTSHLLATDIRLVVAEDVADADATPQGGPSD